MKTTKYIIGTALTLILTMSSVFATSSPKSVKEKSGVEEEITSTETNSTTDIIVVNIECDNKWGVDSVKAVEQYSLYREFYKQKNYIDAMKHWEYVIQNAPCARKTPYNDGIKMLKAAEKTETDAGAKIVLQNRVLELHDNKIKYFGKKGYQLGRKLMDMVRYKQPTEAIYATAKESVSLQKNKSEYFVLKPFSNASLAMYNTKQISKDELIVNYETIIAITEANEGHEKYAEKFINAKESLTAQYSSPELGIFSCEDIRAKYEPMYPSNSDNMDFLKEMYKKYESFGCMDDPIIAQIIEKMYTLEPSASKAVYMANKYKKEGNNAKYIEYMENAISMETEASKKATYYYNIAVLQRTKMKSFSEARKYARKALEQNPNMGKAYMLIGDMYASSGSSCGKPGFERQVVAWAAVDMYYQAKKMDPSMAADAQARINKYSAYFPSKEDIFFRNLKIGGSYTVGCWIGKGTTIRSRD